MKRWSTCSFYYLKNCTLFLCFFSLKEFIYNSRSCCVSWRTCNVSNFLCPSQTLPSSGSQFIFCLIEWKKKLQHCFSWQMLSFTSSIDSVLTLGNAFLAVFHLYKLDAGKLVRCSSSAAGIVQSLRIIDILHKPIYPGSSCQYRMWVHSLGGLGGKSVAISVTTKPEIFTWQVDRFIPLFLCPSFITSPTPWRSI